MTAAVSSPAAPSRSHHQPPGGSKTWVCDGPGSTPDVEQARALARAGVTAAEVTLYGPTAEIHAFHTRDRSSFAGQLRGARALVEARIPVGLTIPVTRANVRHLTELVDVAVSVGATALRFTRDASSPSPSPPILTDHLDAALRRAARLHLRAVVHEPTADDPIFGGSVATGPHSLPNLRSSARSPSTPLSQPQR